MLRKSRIVFAALTMSVVFISAPAQSKFQLKVHTGRGVSGDVNSTMISGERDMLVIDPEFSLSEADKLAAEILESKYIADWDVNAGKSKNAAEMRENVRKQYPNAGMEFTLNDRIATYFPAAK